MTALTKRIRHLVRVMFVPSDVDAAERALIDGCGRNLAGLETAGAEVLDRVRSAAIRLSAGRMNALRQGIDLAAVDWRDLLVAAGFAADATAHTSWRPRRLNPEDLERWFAAGSLAGVAFAPNQPVTVTLAVGESQSGSIISLEALEPEPQYLVELASGRELTVFQRNLTALD